MFWRGANGLAKAPASRLYEISAKCCFRFQISLEQVRRALSIWSGFEVNTRAPQRSFSLCVE